MQIRINKFLADAGVSSRRGADALIEQGIVRVNGKVLMEPGYTVDTLKDVVTVKGERISAGHKEFVYVAVNKPAGYTSTVRDRYAEKTVIDLYKSKDRVYPVGRLDKDSEGLMLLTNDGDLALKMTHPRYHVPKTYRVFVVGTVDDGVLQRLKSGVRLEDGFAKASDARMVTKLDIGTWIEIVLHEGKKRQIRRMCSALHLHVKKLVRVAIGEVQLGDLRSGEWRMLTEEEIRKLKS